MSSLGSPKKRLRSQTAEENKEEAQFSAKGSPTFAGSLCMASFLPPGTLRFIILMEIWQLVRLILILKPNVVFVMLEQMSIFYYFVIYVILLRTHTVLAWAILFLMVIGFVTIVLFPGRPISMKNQTNKNFAPTAEPSVTINIFDIVRETGSRVVNRPRASPLQQNLSSPVIPLPDRLSYLSRLKGKGPVTGVCNMQRNVKVFRENWNALRSGSFQFRCNSFQPGSTVSQKQDSSSLSHHKLDGLHSMASTSLQQSTVQGGPSNKMLNERVFKDADKAWKMMDRAKRIQRLIIEQAAFYRE
ncbi:hypothetical protein D0Y65_011009 [Glycine soja]|uniref:Uncharacterized protein n=2 Tax=Glycine soja TaxID=3848 RepID=A0A445KI11_GLYSO|nr:hypothetical protein D0Y65_011009 [Glycine soja]